MNSVGAAFVSSQWYAGYWAPEVENVTCPKGDNSLLPNSVVTISNIRVMGSVKLGPVPSKCVNGAHSCTTTTTTTTTSTSLLLLQEASNTTQMLSTACGLRHHLLLQAAAFLFVQLCMFF